MKKDKKKSEMATRKKAAAKRKKTGRIIKAKQELRVLILEDNAADAELMERQLRREKIAFSVQRAETRAGFNKALEEFQPDLVLADYTLPRFNAMEALKLARKRFPFIPFIVVTGSIGEEKAVACLRAGADDYLLKDRQARLGEAALHAIKRSRLHLEKAAIQARLEVSEERYRSLFENSVLGIYRTTSDGRILLANPMLLNMLGYRSLAELQKRNLQQEGFEHSHSRAAFKRRLRREKKIIGLESVWLRKNGKPIHVRENALEIFDPLARTRCFEGTVEDISERKRAEGELRKLSRAMEQSPVSIIITDPQGRIEYVNPKFSELTGYRPGEVLGKNPRLLKSGETQASEYQRLWQTITTGGTWRGEFRNRKKNGKPYWESASISPVLDDTGRITHFMAIKEDISELKRVMAVLSESESRFATIFNSSPIPIAITRIDDGRFLDVNKAWQALTGYGASETVGRAPHDLGLWVAPRARERLISDLKRSGTVRDLDVEVRLKSGETRQMLMSAEQIVLSGVECMLSMAVDISERKRTEIALRESEERFANLFRRAPLGYQSLDAEGRFLEVNDAWLETLGYEREEVIGKWFGDFLTTEFVAAFRERFPVFKARGTIHSEFEMIHKYGQRKTIAFEGRVGHRKDGSFEKTHCILQDISERKQAEEALRRSQEQFRIAQDMSPDGFTILQPVRDAQGRIADFTWVYENAAIARLNGTDPEAVVGKRLLELFPGHRDTPLLRTYQKVAESGETCIIEADYSGESMVKPTSFRLVVVPMTGNIAILAQDLTQRKHAEELIKASLREKDVLLKEIHHRVKNNLQVISGLLTLQAQQIDDERLQHILLDSQSRIWTMALIHQTLYQSGNLAAINMADYLHSLCGNLLSSHARVATPPTIIFDLLPLSLDIDKAIPLALIVNELVTNAFKHAFPDGRAGEMRISLQECTGRDSGGGAARSASAFELTISDNGIGLPAGFDLKKQKSLGLQLVHMLTQQLGGSVAFQSTGGTAVRITFENEKEN